MDIAVPALEDEWDAFEDEQSIDVSLRRSLSPSSEPDRRPAVLGPKSQVGKNDVDRAIDAPQIASVSNAQYRTVVEDESLEPLLANDISNTSPAEVHLPDRPADEAKPNVEVEVEVEVEAKPKIETDRNDTPLRGIGVDTPPPSAGPTEDRQCRICLGGVEDEPELGRLISPCLCAGSMRYVHLNCINEWRGTGSNAKSFMECPQCGYEYHIRRTAVVGLATSRPLLMFITSVLFLGTTLLAGHLLLNYLISIVAAEEKLKETLKDTTTTKLKSPYDDEYDVVYSTNIHFLGGTALIYDIVSEAIQTFIILAGDIYDYFEDGGWFSNFCLDIAVRLLLGLSVLGSISGLTLLASLSLFAPLQLVYALRGTGIFDGLRRRLNNRNLTFLIVAFVVLGIFNSIVQVYDIVQSITKRVLRYVETQILEVHSPEARASRKHHSPGWWERWWAERRWRTASGWSEVRLRAWIAVKEWARQWKTAITALGGHGEAQHGN